MAWSGMKLRGWRWGWGWCRVVLVAVIGSVFMASVVFSARVDKHGRGGGASFMKRGEEEKDGSFLMDLYDFLWLKDGRLGYTHTWPVSPNSLVCLCFLEQSFDVYRDVGSSGNGIWLEDYRGIDNWVLWSCFW